MSEKGNYVDRRTGSRAASSLASAWTQPADVVLAPRDGWADALSAG
jgi:hypothetical protein